MRIDDYTAEGQARGLDVMFGMTPEKFGYLFLSMSLIAPRVSRPRPEERYDNLLQDFSFASFDAASKFQREYARVMGGRHVGVADGHRVTVFVDDFTRFARERLSRLEQSRSSSSRMPNSLAEIGLDYPMIWSSRRAADNHAQQATAQAQVERQPNQSRPG